MEIIHDQFKKVHIILNKKVHIILNKKRERETENACYDFFRNFLSRSSILFFTS